MAKRARAGSEDTDDTDWGDDDDDVVEWFDHEEARDVEEERRLAKQKIGVLEATILQHQRQVLGLHKELKWFADRERDLARMEAIRTDKIREDLGILAMSRFAAVLKKQSMTLFGLFQICGRDLVAYVGIRSPMMNLSRMWSVQARNLVDRLSERLAVLAEHQTGMYIRVPDRQIHGAPTWEYRHGRNDRETLHYIARTEQGGWGMYSAGFYMARSTAPGGRTPLYVKWQLYGLDVWEDWPCMVEPAQPVPTHMYLSSTRPETDTKFCGRYSHRDLYSNGAPVFESDIMKGVKIFRSNWGLNKGLWVVGTERTSSQHEARYITEATDESSPSLLPTKVVAWRVTSGGRSLLPGSITVHDHPPSDIPSVMALRSTTGMEGSSHQYLAGLTGTYKRMDGVIRRASRSVCFVATHQMDSSPLVLFYSSSHHWCIGYKKSADKGKCHLRSVRRGVWSPMDVDFLIHDSSDWTVSTDFRFGTESACHEGSNELTMVLRSENPHSKAYMDMLSLHHEFDGSDADVYRRLPENHNGFPCYLQWRGDGAGDEPASAADAPPRWVLYRDKVGYWVIGGYQEYEEVETGWLRSSNASCVHPLECVLWMYCHSGSLEWLPVCGGLDLRFVVK